MHTRFPKWKLAAFALLSVCDFTITYFLLSRREGDVYESNPLANHWLDQSGWIGLAAFKAVFVGVVAFIAVYLYSRRPRIAHDLLAVACGAVVVAVLTGTTIAVTTPAAPPEDEPMVFPDLDNQKDSVDARTMQYVALLDEAGTRLISKEWTLAQAVELAQATALAQDGVWFDSLRRTYPGLDDRALLAADLLQHTVGSRVRTPIAVGLANRLEAEFNELYGVVPALPYRPMLQLIAPPAKSPRPSRVVPNPPPI